MAKGTWRKGRKPVSSQVSGIKIQILALKPSARVTQAAVTRTRLISRSCPSPVRRPQATAKPSPKQVTVVAVTYSGRRSSFMQESEDRREIGVAQANRSGRILKPPPFRAQRLVRPKFLGRSMVHLASEEASGAPHKVMALSG